MQLAPSALHATGEDLATRLGWQLDGLDYDGIVHLQGDLERQIGMRLINNGSTVQLWATGGTQPTDHPADAVAPLPYRHRYHMAVHIGALTEDQDPGIVLYNTVRDNLLPVFDAKPYYVGHRPWEPDIAPAVEPDAEATIPAAAGVDEQPASAAAPEPQTPADQPAPQPEPEPEAKPAAKRTRRTKADPAAEPKPRPTRKRTAAKPKPATS
ncbi:MULTISPECIES: hypothetical protein [unclassified Streptomyces]|uniref:hypothetical protein n=1 Tax=unclassified Streptomyces TaxID=2593676 RepID=UPI0029B4F053|nr:MULTISPECIES: hypothetical protein [unclassified Streptomyces]MDX3766450.1 hypothetical protein [Streptomyces sp. AK08-01B]MDX3816293.1 hypothetical protein [Streptomyces sp. AK08-01A]